MGPWYEPWYVWYEHPGLVCLPDSLYGSVGCGDGNTPRWAVADWRPTVLYCTVVDLVDLSSTVVDLPSTVQ